MGPCLLEMWHSGLPPTPPVPAGSVSCHVSNRWVGCLPRTAPLLPSESATWRQELATGGQNYFASSSNDPTNITMSANNEPFYIRY